MSLNTKQRREQILSLAYERGEVEVKLLAQQMSVSEATVRRDLHLLAEAGEIELVYGGATLPRVSDYSFRSKSMRNIEAKQVIGRLAAELVPDNEQLFIDSGTTCLQMAAHLKRRHGLQVIHNSVRLAAELGGIPEVTSIMIGGQYRAERMDTVGPLATQTLEQLRGFVAFIGADGLGMEFGITASDIESANLHRLALRNAREAVLLADNSKFRSPSLFKIADFSGVQRLVTDQPPPEKWREFFAGRGIQVVTPQPPAAEGAAGEEADDPSANNGRSDAQTA